MYEKSLLTDHVYTDPFLSDTFLNLPCNEMVSQIIEMGSPSERHKSLP